MRRLGVLIFGFVILITSSCVSRKNTVPEYEGYQLIWNDEFNEEGKPSSENWDYEIDYIRVYQIVD